MTGNTGNTDHEVNQDPPKMEVKWLRFLGLLLIPFLFLALVALVVMIFGHPYMR